MVIRSGTEEEYSNLMQLLEDISTYTRDMQDQKKKKTRKQETEGKRGEAKSPGKPLVE